MMSIGKHDEILANLQQQDSCQMLICRILNNDIFRNLAIYIAFNTSFVKIFTHHLISYMWNRNIPFKFIGKRFH